MFSLARRSYFAMSAPAFATPMPPGSSASSSSRSPLLSRAFRRPSSRATPVTRSTIVSSAASDPDTNAAPRRFGDLFPEASSASVLTPSGDAVSLISHVDANTAASRAVLLGWLRHYGCTLCKKQAADWRDLAPRLRECGDVALVLVGNGTPQQARDFVDEMHWQGDMFTDPSRTAYQALQFRKKIGDTFNLPALKKVIGSFGEGNKQTLSRLPTDAFQQGGAILVDRNGFVKLFHADAFAGDHIDVEELYKQTCEACAIPVPT